MLSWPGLATELATYAATSSAGSSRSRNRCPTDRVSLIRSTRKVLQSALVLLNRDKWSDGGVTFKLTGKETADEILFRAPSGAELHVDDVLLFTPGEEKK